MTDLSVYAGLRLNWFGTMTLYGSGGKVSKERYGEFKGLNSFLRREECKECNFALFK